MKEFFKIAINNIMHRKLRSWLTMIGIFIGIAAVVSLVALGNGLEGAVSSEFEKLGFNRIIITPAGAFMGPLSGEYSNVKLTDKDIDTVKKVSGVQHSAGIIARSVLMTYRDETKAVNAYLHEADKETLETLDDANLFDVEIGREFRKTDTGKVIVGWTLANDVFERKIRPGDEIEIFNQKFKVIGIQKKTGAVPYDNGIRLNLGQMKKYFDISDKYTVIIAIVDPKGDVEAVANDIKKELRKERGIKEGEEDFTVQTAKQVLDTVMQIFNIIQAVVVGIAAISLIVGAVGIANTMYTSVLDRTQEIGVMKAIGAKNSDIVAIFLIESGLFGLVGGIIGLGIGYGIATFVAYIARTILASNLFVASVTPGFMIGMLAFSFVLGSIAGILPALQASKLQPVEALRYE